MHEHMSNDLVRPEMFRSNIMQSKKVIDHTEVIVTSKYVLSEEN